MHKFQILFPSATLFMLIFIFVPILSQDLNQLNLEDCLRLALQKSRLIRVSDLTVQQSVARIYETQAQRLPSLSLNGTYTHIGKITSFSIPMGGTERTFRFGTPDRFNIDARLQLSIFTWGRISNSIRLSIIGKDLSRQQRRLELSGVIYQTLQAYFSVLLNEQMVSLQQQNVSRASEFYQISQKRFATGGLPRLELLRSEVQMKNSESSLQEARGNLTKSRLFLAKTVGLPENLIILKGALQYHPVSIDIAEISDRAMTVRSDLAAIDLQQEMKRQEIKLARAVNRPNIFLFSGYNVQNGFDPTDPDRFVSNWNFGFQLSFPIFDGFAAARKTEQAQLEASKVSLQKEELREMIQLQIRQAVTTLEQAALNIESRQTNSELATEALEVATDQYQLGVSSSLDVLNAQQTLSQNEILYTQALFNHIMSKLEISRIMEDYGWFIPDIMPEEIERLDP